jgi:hypothetical protein
MSKKRYFDTKFWSDGYIEGLDPIEKLLFLYLLTNERTNVAGVYELPRKIMSVETGIEISMLDNILARFEAEGKIVTFEKWMRLINSDKYQNLDNRNIRVGIENVLSKVPMAVQQGLNMTLEESSMSHTRLSNNLDLDLDSDLDLNKAKKSPMEKAQKPVDEVAKLYYETIKELQLPVRNHVNLKSRIKALEKDVGKEDALKYLTFVKDYYKVLTDDGYKPRLTEGLDIYAKRLNLKAWIERKVIDQTKPATAGGRPII